MSGKEKRVALGDRVLPSLRRWLGRLAVTRGCASRSDLLESYLAAGAALSSGGADPVEVLELAVMVQGRGVDPAELLSSAIAAARPRGRNGRARRC